MISPLRLSLSLTSLGLSASLLSYFLAFTNAKLLGSLTVCNHSSKRIVCSQNCVCLLTLFSNLMIKQSRACYKLFATLLVFPSEQIFTLHCASLKIYVSPDCRLFTSWRILMVCVFFCFNGLQSLSKKVVQIICA